jgi:CRISPR-associated protein Csb1
MRRLLDGDLRLRTACDLEPIDRKAILATRPEGFVLPSLEDLEVALPAAIVACRAAMTHTSVSFEDELRKGKDKPDDGEGDGEGSDSNDEQG